MPPDAFGRWLETAFSGRIRRVDRTVLDLARAAAYVHMDALELKHAAQRGDAPGIRRGDDVFVFERGALHEWAQRRMIGLTDKELSAEHQAARAERRNAGGADFRVSTLLAESAINPFLTARNRGGVLRDMADLAEATGLVYDSRTLFAELQSREEAASTATGGGAAFLHPRYHDPYLFEDSFLAIGRAIRPVFFGSQDGEGTDIFFLICCTDHQLHLHILARLCLLAHGTSLLEDLRASATAEEMRLAFVAAEDSFLLSSIPRR